MSKAYDHLEWSFIRKVLLRLGFATARTKLIIRCCSTVSCSFLINDSAHGKVFPLRGIRQGDPLSPYIIILCSEVLLVFCVEAHHIGHLAGICAARRAPQINHFLFADDTMFFLKTDEESCDTLTHILWSYEQASGQMINVNKSSIIFSTKPPQETHSCAKSCLRIVKEGGVGKYLRLSEILAGGTKIFSPPLLIGSKSKPIVGRRGCFPLQASWWCLSMSYLLFLLMLAPASNSRWAYVSESNRHSLDSGGTQRIRRKFVG